MKYMDGSEKFPEIKLMMNSKCPVNFYSQLRTNSGLSRGIWEKEKGFKKCLNAALTFTSSMVLAKVPNPSELLFPYI